MKEIYKKKENLKSIDTEREREKESSYYLAYIYIVKCIK